MIIKYDHDSLLKVGGQVIHIGIDGGPAVGVGRKVKGDVHTSEATSHLPGPEGKGGAA